MNQKNDHIRDFIYLDLQKVSSLFSQITGGLVTGTEIISSDETDHKSIKKFDFKIFTPEYGSGERQTAQMSESRVMHHDLFNRVEQLLFDNGYAIDLNEDILIEEIEAGTSHEKFKETFYIRCTGWPIFEDYKKMKFIAQRYNTIMKFIKNSSMSSLKQTDEYRSVIEQIENAKSAIRKENNKSKKALLKKQVGELEKDINRALEQTVGGDIEEWIIDGFSDWVDTFIQDAMYFHIYPYETFEKFHVKATLNRENFVDGDERYTDFAYTARPNVKLTLFGLITSIPTKEAHPFDPMKEFEGHVTEDKHDDPIGFEKAFRGIFRGFDGVDGLSKFDRYPNLTVYPLAVFRDIYPKKLAADPVDDDES